MMRKLIDSITKVIHIFLGIILVSMLIITFIQVLLRYILNSPLVWAEEVTLILLVWYGYLIIAVLIRSNEHIALEFIYSRLNSTLQRTLDLFKYLLVLGFAILMIYFGFEMFQNALGKNFPASQIPRSIINLPMAISGILISIYTFHHLIRIIRMPHQEGGQR